jgi:hypothetical protein
MPVAAVKSACLVISTPRSQVKDWRIVGCSWWNAAVMAVTTVVVVASIRGRTSR